MASCMCELHIWSLKNQYAIPDDVIGVHCYHDKGEIVSRAEQPYCEEKQQFEEGRDITWTPRNKRPERLRDSLKEVEELLSQFTCVRTRWRNRYVFQVVLSNVCIISFIMSKHCGDVEKIYIDKSLVGKLSCETICDAYLTDQYLIASHSHLNRIDYAYFTKRPPLNEAAKRLDKLSLWEPRVTQLEIPGPKGRRLERNISMNTAQDMVLVWWSFRSGEAWPWSPMSSDKELANLCILNINGPMIDVMAYTKTEAEPVNIHFSCLQPHRLFSLEQQVGGHGEITARSCTYEIIRGEIQTATVVNIPLKSTIVCEARSPQEEKLVLGLSDCSLVMYDDHKKVTLFTRAAILKKLSSLEWTKLQGKVLVLIQSHYLFTSSYPLDPNNRIFTFPTLSSLQPPANIAWHPNGTLLLVSSARADIQIFDRGLSPLRIQLVSEEPAIEKFLRVSKFFRTSIALRHTEWCPFPPQNAEFASTHMDIAFLSFTRGPIALLQFHLGIRSRERFSCVELIREYIKHKQMDEAINLLSSLNWDHEGLACYTCLSAIVNYLLRMPLNSEREAQLEAALATFYAPKPAISEATVLEYRDPISHLARRFFHHLLRYVRFDKAFLLAVDIGARDLFMDIHYMASDKGETALAEVARRKAEQIENDTPGNLEVFDDEPYLLSSDQSLANNARLAQEAQERFGHQLPSSRHHPWQQEYYSSRQNNSATNRNTRSDVGTEPRFADGSFPDLGDLRLQDDLIVDYTAALMDRNFDGAAGIQSHNGEDDDEDTRTEVDENGTKVKVIHFGIV